MKNILKLKRIYLLGLTPISFLLIFTAQNNSYFAEQIFAKHIYKWISQFISIITGFLPFSLAEIIIIAIPAIILVILTRFIIIIAMNKGNRLNRLLKGLLNILCTGSVVLFLFTMMGGLNYYRYSFGQYSNLEVRESSIDELFELTKGLVLQANGLREILPNTDEEGIYRLSMSHGELAKLADQAFDLLSSEYPILKGYYGSPKPVIFSEAMSATEITGIFIPFTMEANINVDVPDYTIAATMFHELAHQRGFMREDEANFIAYLAGMKSGHPELQYSSTMLALITAGNALYNQDTDRFFQIRDLYSEGVLIDIRDNSAYWQQFENTAVSAMSNRINDTYLKANAQTDGVKSYGRMLDLLLAKYRADLKEIEMKYMQ